MSSNGTSSEPTREQARRRFRVTLASVMTVQVVTLVLLWLLQRAFS